MKRFIAIVLCALLFFSSTSAQDLKRPETYNYVRGLEAVKAQNYHEALDFLNKEIEESPKNGYAYSWIAVIRQHFEEYGKAITALDLAIKYLPKKDKTYCSWAYITKSQVYQSLYEYDKAITCMNQAIAVDPEDAETYDKRAQLYFELEKYDDADKDYQKMVSIQPGDVMGYMGLGRNEKMRKNYDAAIKQFDYVIKLASEYSSGYAFRGECYLAQMKYNEAAADIVKALSINNDRKAFHHMQEMADSCMAPLVAKLKIESAKSSTDAIWPCYLGVIYERTDQYLKAAEYYKKSYRLEASDVTAYRIANCFDDYGDYVEALRYTDLAIQNDSTNEDYVLLRARINDNMGNAKDAISDMDKYISMQPEHYFGYYRRGRIKDHTGDYDGAVEDYSTSIMLKPEYSYTYLNRGVLYRLLGKYDFAKADFEKIVEIDTLKEENHTPYALFYLDRKQEAIDFMNNLLSKGEDKSICYEAACLYSIMNEKETSIRYLRKALELGNREFNHIHRDRDLNNIRENQEFKDLMTEFEDIHKQEVSANTKTSVNKGATKTAKVLFTKEEGLCKVKCQINGLPLHFIFDTGASDVSISNVEASFMMKNGYLKSSDVIGKQNYMNANGDITEGTVINLRSVNFGGLHLENVKSSVVKNQKAPLLLGQSVLNRLGKIEIDNTSKVLKITYRE